MAHSRPLTFLTSAAVIPLTALAVAACGGGSTATAAAPLPATNGHAATVGVGKTGLGTILINSGGRTLYLFKADVGTKSACSGACATAWPPLLTNGKPTASGGAKVSLLGTTARSDGTRQVTYNGHPLYRYAADAKPGDDAGQALNQFGAEWYVLAANGSKIDND